MRLYYKCTCSLAYNTYRTVIKLQIGSRTIKLFKKCKLLLKREWVDKPGMIRYFWNGSWVYWSKVSCWEKSIYKSWRKQPLVTGFWFPFSVSDFPYHINYLLLIVLYFSGTFRWLFFFNFFVIYLNKVWRIDVIEILKCLKLRWVRHLARTKKDYNIQRVRVWYIKMREGNN